MRSGVSKCGGMRWLTNQAIQRRSRLCCAPWRCGLSIAPKRRCRCSNVATRPIHGPREAIEASRAFGQGQRRDKHLRIVALAALRAGKEVDAPSKYAARAATLAAAVAYTHTDLQTGLQGVRQAQHVLGPAVYAALSLETAASGDPTIGTAVIHRAIARAPVAAGHLLKYLPPQPEGRGRIGVLFSDLDAALRGEQEG